MTAAPVTPTMVVDTNLIGFISNNRLHWMLVVEGNHILIKSLSLSVELATKLQIF